ncbi:NADP-dependent oxidoreductase domain-containing protein [Hyaloraphidium curvatum]|nr:NADP-dependent oxidoreductase domain-containing protein [Hyaloraphidium curvatum]
MPMETRPLGKNGPQVGRIGIGAMGMTAFYNPDPAATEADSLATFDALIEFCKPEKLHVDSAWIYSHPSGAHNETLVGKAVAKHGRDKFFLATKFGFNPKLGRADSSEENIRNQIADSLKRLGTDHIDLYYQHRVDPLVPMADVAKTLKALVAEGKVKHIGLSECTAAELREAHAVHPVSAIQMEWSLQSRDIEDEIVPTARELGVAIVAYSPLGRGFLSQTFSKPEELPDGDWRKSQPRFQEDTFKANAEAGASLRALADKLGATPAQLALAWLLKQGDDVFPIPGSKATKRALENMGAVEVANRLTAEDVKAIEAAVPAAKGDRYQGMQGTHNSRAQKPL